MDLQESCSNIRKEFVLNTEYDKAVAILLEFCEAVLKAKGMPLEKGCVCESGILFCDCGYAFYNQGRADMLAYHAKIMSRISIDRLTVRIGYELAKYNVQTKAYFSEELAAAIVAGLKEVSHAKE